MGTGNDGGDDGDSGAHSGDHPGQASAVFWSRTWFDVFLYGCVDLCLSNALPWIVLVIVRVYLAVSIHLSRNRSAGLDTGQEPVCGRPVCARAGVFACRTAVRIHFRNFKYAAHHPRPDLSFPSKVFRTGPAIDLSGR